MKSILFTTTALVAFAGAAAADVSLTGEASAEYNSDAGYSTAAEMTASASATLDNGITASTSFTLETEDFGSAEFAAGSVSLSNETASLTFGTAVVGAIFSATADDYAVGTGAVEDGEISGIAASVAFGETTVFVSGEMVAADTELGNLEVAATTTAAGWSLGFGFTDGSYTMTAAGTAGGADVNFGMSSDDEWDAGVSYAVGTVTVSASTDEAEAWTVGAAYAADGVSAGIEYNADETWEVSGGYAADGITVAAAFTDANVVTLGATYDMGNGLTVGAGLEDDVAYSFASYDLGGGANAFVDYTDSAAALSEVGPSERDIAIGTTVGVSFTF